jgi:hypothetical protein
MVNIPSLTYKGKSLFNKETKAIVIGKYKQMEKNPLPKAKSFGYYSAKISMRDIDKFLKEYKKEMNAFIKKHRVVGYKVPLPDVHKRTRIAEVSLSFSKPGYAVSLGGETYAKQQVLHPITEFDRQITFAKAISILDKYKK